MKCFLLNRSELLFVTSLFASRITLKKERKKGSEPRNTNRDANGRNVGAVKNADIFFCRTIIPIAKSFENNLVLNEAVMRSLCTLTKKEAALLCKQLKCGPVSLSLSLS